LDDTDEIKTNISPNKKGKVTLASIVDEHLLTHEIPKRSKIYPKQ